MISSNSVLCQYNQGGVFTVWNFEKQNNKAEYEGNTNWKEQEEENSKGRSSLQTKSTNFNDYNDDTVQEDYDYGDYFFKNFER